MIKQATDIIPSEKRIRILIAGYPGIGKSTLGLSAPKALHIDTDFGLDRIEPQYRRPYIQPKTYEELLNDLQPENLTDFETLVFDTGGKLLDLMKPWAIRKDIKNGKRDGNLSLQGYGEVGREFVRLMDYCFYELKKHIVVVFHAIEEKDGENTRLRLMVEGQTRNNVWIPMDLGGYIEMIGNDRTLGLSNCERYYAKGTRGINGIIKIPALTNGKHNDFLTQLFNRYNEKNIAEVAQYEERLKAYENIMAQGRDVISQVSDAESANEMAKAMAKLDHVLTSREEIGEEWKAKIAELQLTYDKKTKLYVDPEATDAQEA